MATPAPPPGAPASPEALVAALQAALADPDESSKVDPAPVVRAWLIDLVDGALAATNDALDAAVKAGIACQYVQLLANSLRDPAPTVVKRATATLGSITAVFFAKAVVDPAFVPTWQSMIQIRDTLLPLIPQANVNDGVKLAILKYMQALVLILSLAPMAAPASTVSVSRVPPTHPALKPSELLAMGAAMVDIMVKMCASGAMSPSCTTTLIALLTQIATERPQHLPMIAQSFLAMIAPLQHQPATLARNSTLRAVKVALLLLAKHPAVDSTLFATLCDTCQHQLGAKWHELPRRRRDAHDPENAKAEAIMQNRIAVAEAIHSQIDVTALPLNVVVEIIVESLRAIPEDQVMYAISRQRQRLADEAAAHAASGHATVPTAATAAAETPVAQESMGVDGAAAGRPSDDVDRAAAIETPVPQDEVMDEDEDEDAAAHRYAAIGLDAAHPMDVFMRLLDAESIVADDGDLAKKPLRTNRGRAQWIGIVTRLIARVYHHVGEEPTDEDVDDSALGNQLRQCLADHICAAFRARHELALVWLHEEWKQGHVDQARKWALALLDRVLEEKLVEPRDKSLVRFVADMPPVVPADVLVARLAAVCLSPTVDTAQPIFMASVLALKELVDFHPKARTPAFCALRTLAVHPIKGARAPAIIAFKQYYPDHPSLGPLVRHHAVRCLARIVHPRFVDVSDENLADATRTAESDDAVFASHRDPTDMPTSPTKSAPEAPDARRDARVLAQLELVLALCTRDPHLLADVFAASANMPLTVQPLLREHIAPLVRYIAAAQLRMPSGEVAAELSALLDVLKECPPRSEPLALRVLVLLTNGLPLVPELVEVGRKLHDERGLGGKFLLPIIGGLDKGYILRHLSQLVAILDGSEQSKKIWREVVTRVSDGAMPIVPPAELMVALHMLDAVPDLDLRKVMEATQLCLQMPHLFTGDTLAKALHVMSESGGHTLDPATNELTGWPKLLMRTLIQALNLHPTLAPFAKNMLLRLATRGISRASPLLWEGFLRAFRATLPTSLSVALAVPHDALEKLLDRVPDVRQQLIEWIDGKGLARQPRMARVWGILTGEGVEQQQVDGTLVGAQEPGDGQGPPPPSDGVGVGVGLPAPNGDEGGGAPPVVPTEDAQMAEG
ncbi:hypothetical protein AMAG_10839 [Allomyces macrogynus ATCC 38327]|uniref:Symplekin n=1 Tax=Allomyces macrogynus (strain ATCC 38327) TaxID=578462 RepID=A0A0L0SRN6_ALLM3|nr:hypothetical protein AMAG_10839 [Allomyces macrogynus ATCC 38327]|eukprot:KNE65187.1 hypothetical protein AMAG_10839 [Allomyces macrogynus ATCC 38327]